VSRPPSQAIRVLAVDRSVPSACRLHPGLKTISGVLADRLDATSMRSTAAAARRSPTGWAV
jgi:hypothetical protein